MNAYEDWKDQGDMALAIGELDQAAELYKKAVEQKEDYFDGWHALMMVLMKTERLEEAIEAGKKATQIEPNNQFGWTSLSLAYVRNHQIEEAEAAGAKAKVISWGGMIKTSKDSPKNDPNSK